MKVEVGHRTLVTWQDTYATTRRWTPGFSGCSLTMVPVRGGPARATFWAVFTDSWRTAWSPSNSEELIGTRRGFSGIGDSVCLLDPSFGRGMTVALAGRAVG